MKNSDNEIGNTLKIILPQCLISHFPVCKPQRQQLCSVFYVPLKIYYMCTFIFTPIEECYKLCSTPFFLCINISYILNIISYQYISISLIILTAALYSIKIQHCNLFNLPFINGWLCYLQSFATTNDFAKNIFLQLSLHHA